MKVEYTSKYRQADMDDASYYAKYAGYGQFSFGLLFLRIGYFRTIGYIRQVNICG